MDNGCCSFDAGAHLCNEDVKWCPVIVRAATFDRNEDGESVVTHSIQPPTTRDGDNNMPARIFSCSLRVEAACPSSCCRPRVRLCFRPYQMRYEQSLSHLPCAWDRLPTRLWLLHSALGSVMSHCEPALPAQHSWCDELCALFRVCARLESRKSRLVYCICILYFTHTHPHY